MPFPIYSPKHLCCTVAVDVHMCHMSDVVVGDMKLYHSCELFSSTVNAHMYRQCITVRCEKGHCMPHSSTAVSYVTVVVIQIRFSPLSAEVDRVKQQGSPRFTVRTMVYHNILLRLRSQTLSFFPVSCTYVTFRPHSDRACGKPLQCMFYHRVLQCELRKPA